MVQSSINRSINYSETNELDPDDVNYDATIYEVNVFGKNRYIALGQPKYNYIKKDIIYFPIYLIIKDEVNAQIGVYELPSSTLPQLYDTDNDVDLNKLSNPLLYSFAKPLITKLAKSSLKIIDDLPLLPTSDEDEDEDEDEGEFDHQLEGDETEAEDEEGEEEGEEGEDDGEEEGEEGESKKTIKIQTPKKDSKTELWIQKYLNDPSYSILDNEGGGDCLFAIIRDGLATIGRNITVKELRELLAKEADEETFATYKEVYNDLNKNLDEVNTNLSESVKRNAEIRRLLALSSSTREFKRTLIKEAKDLGAKHKVLLDEQALTENLLDDYRHLEGINTLEDFRDLIKTCRFWAEIWAISTLERILNIKLVIFSSEMYNEGDMDNVLQCGQLNDDKLEKAGVFHPTHYILGEYTGDHYKLITKDGKGAFAFKELSDGIVDLIVAKCLERLAGAYYLIPEFKKYKEHDDVVTSLHKTPTPPHKTPTPPHKSPSPQHKSPSPQHKGPSPTQKTSFLSHKTPSPTHKTPSPTHKTPSQHQKTPSPQKTSSPPQKTLEKKRPIFVIFGRSAAKPFPGQAKNGEQISTSEFKLFLPLSKITDWRKKLSVLGDIELKKGKAINVKTQEINQALANDPELKNILQLTRNAEIKFFKPRNEPITLDLVMDIRDSL